MQKYFFKIDEYGIKNYTLKSKLLFAVSVLYFYISIVAYFLYQAESSAINANILHYRDAFWVLQMSASTIGFGDFYPITNIGRWIVSFTFYVGVGLAGYIGSSIADYFTSFTDTAVQNRELRKQNEEILSLLRNRKLD